MVDLATANGTTVAATLGRSVVLSSNDPTKWTATVADESVATFVAGHDDGSATFNPALELKAAGTSKVTLTDGTSTVTFTLVVS
jgi:hypothetical protein